DIALTRYLVSVCRSGRRTTCCLIMVPGRSWPYPLMISAIWPLLPRWNCQYAPYSTAAKLTHKNLVLPRRMLARTSTQVRSMGDLAARLSIRRRKYWKQKEGATPRLITVCAIGCCHVSVSGVLQSLLSTAKPVAWYQYPKINYPLSCQRIYMDSSWRQRGNPRWRLQKIG